MNTTKNKQIGTLNSYEDSEKYIPFLTVLHELTPTARKVFLLNRYEGQTYTKIAYDCGLSIGSVEKNLIKALTCFNIVLNE